MAAMGTDGKLASPFRRMRKAASRATGMHHAFSPSKRNVNKYLRETAVAVGAGAPQSPLPEDASDDARVDEAPARDAAAAALGDEPLGNEAFGSERSGADADEAAGRVAPDGAAAEPGVNGVPEEEKVWVLGYRVDTLYRFD